MSFTDVYCEENPEHSDCYSECLMCEVERLQEENQVLKDQVARLQHSTGACEQIRKDQMIERLVEENSKLYGWVDTLAQKNSDVNRR